MSASARVISMGAASLTTYPFAPALRACGERDQRIAHDDERWHCRVVATEAPDKGQAVSAPMAHGEIDDDDLWSGVTANSEAFGETACAMQVDRAGFGQQGAKTRKRDRMVINGENACLHFDIFTVLAITLRHGNWLVRWNRLEPGTLSE